LSAGAIPWSELDTLSLDAGNTLVSIDFEWVADELSRLGVHCPPDAVRRAEAAGRPATSRRLELGHSTEGADGFRLYLRNLCRRLDAASALDDAALDELVEALAQVLRSRPTHELWSSVLPRVPDALEAFRELGLRLVVVSNSDGSVEQSLRAQGLRGHFDAVIDSHVVGHEKPDPRIFDTALEAVGSLPQRTLHVGDIYAVDVLGARRAGLHALLLDPYGDWPDVDCERAPDLWALCHKLGSGG
jgi:putative hydrolase of the HAD superfamily